MLQLFILLVFLFSSLTAFIWINKFVGKLAERDFERLFRFKPSSPPSFLDIWRVDFRLKELSCSKDYLRALRAASVLNFEIIF